MSVKFSSSIKFKLAKKLFLTLSLFFTALAIGSVWLFSHSLNAEFVRRLELQHHVLQKYCAQDLEKIRLKAANYQGALEVELWTLDGKLLIEGTSRFGGLGGIPKENEGTPTEVFNKIIGTDGQRYRVISSRAENNGTPYILRTALPEGLLYSEIETLIVACVSMLGLGLLGLTFISYCFAKTALHPVEKIVTTARNLDPKDLSLRLCVHNPEDEIGQLAIVLNNLLDRIEKSFGTLKRFTSDASHELRTPLSAIQTFCEVSLREKAISGNCREIIEKVMNEVSRMTKLTESLLLLTRGDSGRIKLTKEPTDLKAVSNELVEVLGVLGEERGVSIRVTGDSGTANVDPVLMRQSIMALLHNSIKFAPEKSEIQIELKEGAEKVSIAVKDNGCGIEAEHREKIFERFYRVEECRNRNLGGAGLGLPIAQWITQAHGGTILFKPNEPSGSIFEINIPRV